MKALIKKVGAVELFEGQGHTQIRVSGWQMEGTKLPNGEWVVRDSVGGWTIPELSAIYYVSVMFDEAEALLIAKQLARGIK